MAFNHAPCVKIRQCPPIPVSSPIVTGIVGLIDVICRMIVRLPRVKQDSGSCGPPTNTCSRILASSPMSIFSQAT